jgi:hypothetical protein
MDKKKQPVEWIVTGRVVLIGATCIVLAKTREEAMKKALKGEYVDGVELECTSVQEFLPSRAEVNG